MVRPADHPKGRALRARVALVSIALAGLVAHAPPCGAQAFRRGGAEFNAMRAVNLPGGKTAYSVIVTEFFHHGQIAADGGNVAVSTRNQKLVPARVLQLGPGDYCRLAFQTVEGQSSYEVFYGGEGVPKESQPAWTSTEGLLLETREYRDCNPNQLDSVREAFKASRRIGSDYVPNVLHADNPFSLRLEPFLSHYSGYLHIPSQGTYGFLTTSQDASFLLIDDKLVVESPGRHRPIRAALRGSRKDVSLVPGPHKFDYYHVATGNEATMAAAWEVSPTDPKPKPVTIPTEYFRTQAIGRAVCEPVATRASRLVPDFVLGLPGSVPLPDNAVPLVGAQFADRSPKALSMKAKLLWEFGDGQTSEEANPLHVYLHPGEYTVKLTVKAGGKPFEMANRIYIDQPKVSDPSKLHKLDDYLPILLTYRPERLDALALRQFVLAFQAKADRYQPGNPDEPPAAAPRRKRAEKPGEQDGTPLEETAEERAEARAEMLKYYGLAVAAGKVAFVQDSAAVGDEELFALAQVVAPMARDLRGDSQLAYQVWHGASRRIQHPRLRARCALEAADIAINDLANGPLAGKLLEAAEAWSREKPPEEKPKEETKAEPKKSGFFSDVKPFSEPGKDDPRQARARRIWGDYYALTGDGKGARKAYLDAERMVNSARRQVEQNAWRGAHSRSTEQFLNSGEVDRAIAEIRAWQDEFPTEKIDGQLTLLYARYWDARNMPDRAVALAEQLMTVAPDSPYIDQMLLLAAQCEVKRGKIDRAIATLEDLAKKYPGSPLIPQVDALIKKLRSPPPEPPPPPPTRRAKKEPSAR